MKTNILVVDDEPVARQSLSDILRLEGYNVTAVANGEQAVEHIRNHAVDLIVLDLKMPGMNGLDVVQVVNQISPDTQIILLTAFGSMESAVEALRQRVHDYLLKPASPNQVLESVRRGLERRAARLKQKEGKEEVQVFTTSDGTEVDLMRRTVSRGNRVESLTPAEGHLLKVFLENVGKVYSHRELVLLVQGYDVSQREAQEILRPLVSRLRHKLEPFPTLFHRIVSVRGTGYVFEAE
ncbi:MAG: response regulator transcription factor [Anaerolineales bacterium]|nr:response regulator transcription factor [Anaerolineales bacterium]MDW8278239.1 response regulator transcription factor [Anaerolineales bacterium]